MQYSPDRARRWGRRRARRARRCRRSRRRICGASARRSSWSRRPPPPPESIRVNPSPAVDERAAKQLEQARPLLPPPARARPKIHGDSRRFTEICGDLWRFTGESAERRRSPARARAPALAPRQQNLRVGGWGGGGRRRTGPTVRARRAFWTPLRSPVRARGEDAGAAPPPPSSATPDLFTRASLAIIYLLFIYYNLFTIYLPAPS